MLTFVNLLMG